MITPTLLRVEAMQEPMPNPNAKDSTSLVAALFTLSFIAVVGWAGFRVAPRYAHCALNGEFLSGGTHCRYDARSTSSQGLGSSVEEYIFLLRL